MLKIQKPLFFHTQCFLLYKILMEAFPLSLSQWFIHNTHSVLCFQFCILSFVCAVFYYMFDLHWSQRFYWKLLPHIQDALFYERKMTWHWTFIHHVDCSKENKSRISELSPSICRWAEPRAERDCYASLKGIPQKQKYLNKSISTHKQYINIISWKIEVWI